MVTYSQRKLMIVKQFYQEFNVRIESLLNPHAHGIFATNGKYSRINDQNKDSV